MQIVSAANSARCRLGGQRSLLHNAARRYAIDLRWHRDGEVSASGSDSSIANKRILSIRIKMETDRVCLAHLTQHFPFHICHSRKLRVLTLISINVKTNLAGKISGTSELDQCLHKVHQEGAPLWSDIKFDWMENWFLNYFNASAIHSARPEHENKIFVPSVAIH